MKPIWIVDDDQSIRFVLEKALLREGLPTRSFTNPREVMAALEGIVEADQPQVLVSDIRMPGGSGLDLLTQIKTKIPSMAVIIMTAYSDLDSAVSSFQGGAFEYLPKPFDVPKAVELIRRALQESQREAVGAYVSEAAPEMLGQAPAMQDVFRAIGRLSQSNVTVMITGESGSGKELVARALHKHSLRHQGTFVAINTAAIPKDLLESELFGHERGAFTGAQTMRRGRFEQAEGGTLFLDEIGDMPFDLQTRLLRILSDGNFYRVGGHTSIKANVRVIAATHQDLEQRVKAGVFREDLFHRLNVIRLRLPALRERREDVPVLTRHFLQQSAVQLGVEPKRITDSAVNILTQFNFPGNVRQLENICHWLSVMAPAQLIEPKDLPPEVLAYFASSQGVSSIVVPSHSAGFDISSASASGAMDAFADKEHDAISVGKEFQRHGLDNVFGEVALSPLSSSESLDYSLGSFGDVGNRLSSPRPMGAPQLTSSTALDATYAPGVLAHSADSQAWERLLEHEANALLALGLGDVWDILSKRFEAKLIQTALNNTRGRRIEAAQKLGIGRNTITRKIQELGLED
jgi:two-component system nitrogen regulation response regulator GlnG